MAVCRLSKELDFFRPRVGPSSRDGGGAVDTKTETTRMEQFYNPQLGDPGGAPRPRGHWMTARNKSWTQITHTLTPRGN